MKIRDFLIGVGAQVDRSSFSQAENATKNLKNGLFAITGALGAVAGASYVLRRFVGDVAKVGDETIKTARNLGVGAEALQEWQYVAGLAGVQTGEFNNAIKFLQRGIAEASEGTGTALKGFNRLGIAVKNNDGTLKSYDQILKEVAEKLPQLSEAERVATSMDLFSRSGSKMIGMLMQGNEEIDKFRQRAQDLGIVMTEDMMKAMEEYNDRSEDFKKVTFGMKTMIANALIPSMTDFAVKLTNTLVPAIRWLRDNSEQLKSTLQFVGKAFMWVAGATALWGLGSLTAGVVGLTSKLALMGWTGLLAFGKMLALPLLIGAGILVAILIIEDLYKTFTNPNAFTVSRLLWQGWSNAVVGYIKDVDKEYNGLYDTVGAVSTFIVGLGQQIIGILGMVANSPFALTKALYGGKDAGFEYAKELFKSGTENIDFATGLNNVKPAQNFATQQDARFITRYGAMPTSKTTTIGTINITEPVDVNKMKSFLEDDFRSFTNAMEGN